MTVVRAHPTDGLRIVRHRPPEGPVTLDRSAALAAVGQVSTACRLAESLLDAVREPRHSCLLQQIAGKAQGVLVLELQPVVALPRSFGMDGHDAGRVLLALPAAVIEAAYHDGRHLRQRLSRARRYLIRFPGSRACRRLCPMCAAIRRCSNWPAGQRATRYRRAG